MTRRKLNELTYSVLGLAIQVHKELGPGLMESIYEKCLVHLLKKNGITVSSQQRVPLLFQELKLDCDLRYDILVENEIIIEIKAVDAILPVHLAQLMTYLKLLDKAKGILINFNCTNIFKEGQKTIVTSKFALLPE